LEERRAAWDCSGGERRQEENLRGRDRQEGEVWGEGSSGEGGKKHTILLHVERGGKKKRDQGFWRERTIQERKRNEAKPQLQKKREEGADNLFFKNKKGS